MDLLFRAPLAIRLEYRQLVLPCTSSLYVRCLLLLPKIERVPVSRQKKCILFAYKPAICFRLPKKILAAFLYLGLQDLALLMGTASASMVW